MKKLFRFSLAFLKWKKQPSIEKNTEINTAFLSSLPYPAMFVRRADRVIVAANAQAIQFGVSPGGYCWRDFAREQYTRHTSTDAHTDTTAQSEDAVRCAFCCADHCYKGTPFQQSVGLYLHNRYWDTYWVKFNEEVFLHYFIDITEKLEKERELRESALYLTQIRSIMGLATFTFDLVSNVWEGSEMLNDLFGFDPNEPKTPDDWKNTIHPGMRKEVLDYFDEVLRREKSSFRKELPIIHRKEGKVRWVNFIGTVLYDENGDAESMVGAVWDISERKEEQAKLNRTLIFTEALLNSVPNPVFFMDSQARYIGCNVAFSEHLGVTTDEIHGKTVVEVWPGVDTMNFYKSDLELIARHGKSTQQSSLRDKEGNLRDIIITKTVFFDETGKVSGLVGSYVDITDILQIEVALRKSEQMLKAVLDHFPGVVFWKDRDSVYMGCNKAFAKGAGLQSPDDIQGKTDYELPWGTTEASLYLADDKDVMRKGEMKLHIIEKQHQADNKVIWFDTSKVPMKDELGRIIGIIGISNDITERKMAEEQRNFLLACVENTNDLVVVKDLKSRIISANKAWAEDKGITDLKEIIYKTDIGHSGDELQSPNQKAELQAQDLQHGEFISSEKVVRKPDGKLVYYQVKSYPVFDDAGVLIGTGTIETDISNRKIMEETLRNSERRYALLAENITDGIFICRNGLLEFTNKSFMRILGYQPAELNGKQIIDLIATERRTDFEFFLSFDSDTDQIKSIETECIRSDGESVFVEIILNYVSREKQSYGVLQDITERRHIQQKNMLKAIIQTEEQERAHFSKELHDGLGPLLSAIKIYLQWSIRPKSNKSYKEIILKAEEVLEEALTTVKEISNRLSPHLLINYGLSSAIQSFVSKLNETNTIQIRVSSTLERRIDPEIEVALYRVVIECVNNTIKYAHARHIHINLFDENDKIRLHYQDDGHGFDIVNKLDNKKGLGLFNLQNRIKTIGGEIMMFSRPHEGVNYHIVVPLK